jgi:hypothetical protein
MQVAEKRLESLSLRVNHYPDGTRQKEKSPSAQATGNKSSFFGMTTTQRFSASPQLWETAE